MAALVTYGRARQGSVRKAEGPRAARRGLGYLPLRPRTPRAKARLGRGPSRASLQRGLSRTGRLRGLSETTCAELKRLARRARNQWRKLEKVENDFTCPTVGNRELFLKKIISSQNYILNSCRMRCIALGFWETTENTTENPVSFGAYILVGLGREIEIKNK